MAKKKLHVKQERWKHSQLLEINTKRRLLLLKKLSKRTLCNTSCVKPQGISIHRLCEQLIKRRNGKTRNGFFNVFPLLSIFEWVESFYFYFADKIRLENVFIEINLHSFPPSFLCFKNCQPFLAVQLSSLSYFKSMKSSGRCNICSWLIHYICS